MSASTSRTLGIAAAVLGVLMLVVAIVYWTRSAADLPGFFPGHEAGSTHHHAKHGIAAAVVALGLFAFAWFRTAPARPRP